MFSQDFDASLLAETAQLVERRERRLHGPIVEFLVRRAEVLHGVLQGDELRDLERPLDLIHRADSKGLGLLRNVQRRMGSRGAPILVVVHGQMDGVELELAVAKPVRKFGDLGLVLIVKMLSRAEDFDRGNSRGLNSAERRDGQPVIDKEMGGENSQHVVSGLWRWLQRVHRRRPAASRPPK